MQHWKMPAAIGIDVITVTGSLNLFCVPSKSSRHLSPSILPTGCISPDSHPQTEFLASPGTLLVTADLPVIPRLTPVTTGPHPDSLVCIPGLTWFCFTTTDLLSDLGSGLNLSILHRPAHLAQLQAWLARRDICN